MQPPRAEDLFGLSDHAGDSDAASVSADEQDESRAARGSKRRKVAHPSPGDGDSDESGSEDDSASGSDGDESGEEEEDEAGDPVPPAPPASLQPLTPSQLAASRLATTRSGVVYLSRLPPFMRPQKVKTLLSRFGHIQRVFLSPEDRAARTRRVRAGSNKKTLYEEGWAEFTDKHAARLAAETLNATPVGGKKGSYYRDDVWVIKYLPKFKWHHLTAQIAHENAARQARLRAEVAQAHRENKTFARNVERAKMIENMKDSKKRRAPPSAEGAPPPPPPPVEVRRQFRQNKIKGVKAAREEGTASSEGLKKAMGKLF
ncbi:hypothetical protein EV426DRAFT_609911 [Tirmania nivea]|nr:hypothetical protein EV426DRAFT_609911 [Tirmania nivea]